MLFGVEWGIRIEEKALVPVTVQGLLHAEKPGFEPGLRLSHTTPLAGEPLRPLGYFSMSSKYESGGERGIRTPGAFGASPVFKTGAINRSAISPNRTSEPTIARFPFPVKVFAYFAQGRRPWDEFSTHAISLSMKKPPLGFAWAAAYLALTGRTATSGTVPGRSWHCDTHDCCAAPHPPCCGRCRSARGTAALLLPDPFPPAEDGDPA